MTEKDQNHPDPLEQMLLRSDALHERLNELLDERERIHIFELLWKLAYANGEADAHEQHLLRKLADLLHLRHADAIGARLRAEASP